MGQNIKFINITGHLVSFCFSVLAIYHSVIKYALNRECYSLYFYRHNLYQTKKPLAITLQFIWLVPFPE